MSIRTYHLKILGLFGKNFLFSKEMALNFSSILDINKVYEKKQFHVNNYKENRAFGAPSFGYRMQLDNVLKKKNSKKQVGKNRFSSEKFPAVQYRDYAGIERFFPDIQEQIEWPLVYSELYKKSGIAVSKGVLFNGITGTGKTLLAHAIAGELRIPFFYFSLSNITSSIKGNTEKSLKKIFWEAEKNCPSIIFIDELDSIAPNKENNIKEFDKKIASQLLICIDEIRLVKNKPVVILAATNDPENIDPLLRRPGRFDKEINLTLPDYENRIHILNHFCKKMVFHDDLTFEKIAFKTQGYTSGDLFYLINMLSKEAIFRTSSKLFYGKYRNALFTHINLLLIKLVDFKKVMEKIKPGILRNGFNLAIKTNWNEIGGLEKIRKIFCEYVINPIQRIGVKIGKFENKIGLLLFGPPGCGKTLIARATAYESGSNYISIKGPEILNKFLGESEKSIREIFKKARLCPPAIIFFDEFDSIAGKRGVSGDKESFSSSSDRIVNQLLTEMDGIEENNGVYIIAATNRPDIIDPAFLRPGRIDKIIAVPLPNIVQKFRIFKTILYKFEKIPYLNYSLYSKFFKKNHSGADINYHLRESVVDADHKKVSYYRLESTVKGVCLRKSFLLANTNIMNGFNIKKQ
jgi:SpoVK/Ycf46/Vps4 family AAA+-type ATPase